MSARVVFHKLYLAIRRIESILVIIGGVIFMALMFLGTADVVGRFAFNNPITGTLEISQVMMGAIVLFGWAYTQKEGGHVKVDLFYNMFPPKVQKILTLASLILSLALFILIMWQSWNIAMNNTLEGRRFPILREVPSGPYYFLVPIGAFFLILEFIVRIVQLISEKKKG